MISITSYLFLYPYTNIVEITAKIIKINIAKIFFFIVYDLMILKILSYFNAVRLTELNIIPVNVSVCKYKIVNLISFLLFSIFNKMILVKVLILHVLKAFLFVNFC